MTETHRKKPFSADAVAADAVDAVDADAVATGKAKYRAALQAFVDEHRDLLMELARR